MLYMLQWKQQDVFFFINFSKEGISSMKHNWSWKNIRLKIAEKSDKQKISDFTQKLI